MPGTEWATFEHSTGWTEEKNLHTSGTRIRGDGKFDIFLFNPSYDGKVKCVWRCGICKDSMDGYKHCPNCFPDKGL